MNNSRSESEQKKNLWLLNRSLTKSISLAFYPTFAMVQLIINEDAFEAKCRWTNVHLSTSLPAREIPAYSSLENFQRRSSITERKIEEKWHPSKRRRTYSVTMSMSQWKQVKGIWFMDGSRPRTFRFFLRSTFFVVCVFRSVFTWFIPCRWQITF